MSESFDRVISKSKTISRRKLVGGASVVSAAVMANGTYARPLTGQTRTQAARQAGTPAVATPSADIRPTSQTYPLTQETKTFKVMIPHYGTNWADNAFTQWYEERTNVHVEWMVVEDEAALTQLGLQIASGDYPDIIMGFNWSPFELTSSAVAAYGEQGVFVPINDYLADNAPNLNEYVIPEFPIAQKITTMPDGQIYAMPYLNDCYHCNFNTQKMWINTAWLEKLGLAMPTTTDEFTAVLQAFKDSDPNGNGNADEVPLTTSTGWPLDTFLINPFQLSPGRLGLYNNGGTVAAAYAQEGWRDGIAYLSGLSQTGLLSVDAFTQNGDQVKQFGDNNQIGVAPGVTQGVFCTLTNTKPGLWADYQIMPSLKGPSGLQQSYKDYDESHIANVFVITDKCQDPALAVAWADGLYEWEATMRSISGVPDVNWRFATEGEVGIDGEPARWASIASDTPPTEGDTQVGWGQLSPSLRNSKDRLSQAVVGERNLNLEVILYEGCSQSLNPYANDESVDLLRPVFNAEEAARVSELETVIAQYVQEQFATGATGQTNIVDGWEDYLSQLNALGFEEYLGIQQAVYDRMSQAT